jgi:hypothetical protein
MSSIGPVNWGSYSGENLETVMAVLLLQERPTAWRRAASQGDGGVDVVVPVDGGYEVNQVKSFTDRLTPGQKAQIKHSLETVIQDARLDKPVQKWNLLMPLDPTSEDEQWFAKLTKGAPFPCQWLGETFWNSEASKHPHVIDYYFRDGKERLLERVRSLQGLLADPEAPIRPADVVSALQRIQTELNDTDPQYRYEFSATAAPPASRPRPGLVMSETRGTEDGGFITIDVIARYPQAAQDRPIDGSITINLVDRDRGIDLSDDFRAFVGYGRRLVLPDGALDRVEVNAPGGLGGTFEGGQGVVGPRSVPLAHPHRMELELLAPDGEVVETVTVAVIDLTAGELGIEFVGIESAGAFDFNCRVDRPGEGTTRAAAEWNLNQRELAGLPVVNVLPAIRLMNQLCAPNSLRLTLMNGPATVARAEQDLAEAEHDPDETSMEIAEMLASLQPHTPIPILIPGQITQEERQEIAYASRLLAGETIESGPAKVELVVPTYQLATLTRALESGDPIPTTVPLVVALGQGQVPLGSVHTTFSSHHAETIVENGDTCTVILIAEGVEESLVAPAI